MTSASVMPITARALSGGNVRRIFIGLGVSYEPDNSADVRLGLHELLADKEELRDNAQDVEVDAEGEQEADVSSGCTGGHTPRAG